MEAVALGDVAALGRSLFNRLEPVAERFARSCSGFAMRWQHWARRWTGT